MYRGLSCGDYSNCNYCYYHDVSYEDDYCDYRKSLHVVNNSCYSNNDDFDTHHGIIILGMLAVKQWKEMFPDSNIVAETRTDSRHAELISMGITPRLRFDRCEANDMTARYVLIALPPSANKEDYVGEISNACRLWAGPLGQGHLAFTSSIGM